ncbi:MAG: hypothetical protein LQ343_007804 [Gyalolechia ehrenbergii]|nr:MAG: hypothetical protein LQ343_007804 [Gyalolechia ehrenbergii]
MDKPLNLLALDGGGIRGVSILLILDEIMRRVQHDEGLTQLPRPCDYFDLIGGTSTGGLVALMLGRLQMTTKDALRTYNKLTGSVFCKANRKRFYKDGTFKATTLEKEVQELVAAKELGESMLRENDDAALAKTFVCAVPAANMAHPRLFRSYPVRENAATNCKIWEAARATTAAPTFFKRITIADDGGAQEDFLDGALRFNNPARLVLEEAMKSFGGASKLGCLVSIGTGHPGTIGLSQPDAFQKILPIEMVGVLKRIATNCEETAHELAGRFRQSPDRYFRYSVSHGIGRISLEEWKKMNEVQVHTKAYMEEVDISSSVDKYPLALLDTNFEAGLIGPESATEPTSRSSMKYQPSPSSLFTGRNDFLNALEEFFVDQGPGKHLRREYLLYEHVLWIDASNRDTIEQSYKNEAIKLGTISDKKISLAEALRELESYQARWLLLFDGADSLEEISDLFPPGRYGDIIYTSRNPLLRRLPASQIGHVSEMNHNEAPELLLKSARLNVSIKDHQAQALAIVAELGYLALAIDQAGAYIASGECYLDDFLDVFNERHQYLLANEAYKGASGSDRAVYATWDLSYAAIDRQVKAAANEALRQGPRAALQILRVFPFFHNEAIMEDIFRFAAENCNSQAETECEADHGSASFLLRCRPDGRWDSQSFRQGVQTLLSFSLVGQESSRGRFFMHRLVHVWAYDRLTTAEKNRFCAHARDILKRSVTWRFQSSDYTYRRNLLPHITTCQRRSSACSMTSEKEGIAEFALAFSEAGRYKEAEELEVQVMETMKRVLGEEHPDTLSSIANLASTYWNQGRWKEAEELEVQVIETSLRVLGEEHPSTLTCIANLALTYLNQGRYKEAEELEVQVMETIKRVLGEEHPSTLTSMNNLAFTLKSQSRNEDAISLMERCWRLQKQVLGPKHPHTETSLEALHIWQNEEDEREHAATGSSNINQADDNSHENSYQETDAQEKIE